MFNVHSLFYMLCISTASQLALSAETGGYSDYLNKVSSCSRDFSSQNSVVAWPNESCNGDVLTVDGGDVNTSDRPGSWSCPAHSNNSKCYPIWETERNNDEKVESRDASSIMDYKTQPFLRTSTVQVSLGFQALSVTLSWPDGMKHAIFFTDDACQELSIQRPGVSWHVERHETQSKQCEDFPEGLFKSIEFMRQDEYEIFSKRMQGEDDGVGGATWRGIF